MGSTYYYRDAWTPTLHECLQTRQDLGNLQDHYAVAVCRADSAGLRIVGHVSREFLFLDTSLACRKGKMQSAINVPIAKRRSNIVPNLRKNFL